MGRSTKSLIIIMKKISNKVGSQVAIRVDARLSGSFSIDKMSQPYFERMWGWDSHSQNGDLGVPRDSQNFKIQL